MSLLAVERIKLTTTRSPWWCLAVAVVVSLGFAVLFASLAKSVGTGESRTDSNTVVLTAQLAVSGVAGIGLYIVMIMSALAVTTEYRFGVIRTTFLAAPNRAKVILTKAGFLGVIGLVVGEVLAFAAYGLAKLIKSDLPGLSTGEDWRQVAGIGLVYALGSVLAVAVGALLRQSAAAIALLLLFPLLVENLVGLIPRVGENIQKWLPFHNADNFTGSQTLTDGLSPWASLLYFAAFTAVVLGLAVVVVNRRDA